MILRHNDLIANKRVLSTPKRGKLNRGRNIIKYIEILKKNIELDDIHKIKMQMLNRDVWEMISRFGRVRVRLK